ncbi:hypothetical protein AVEN_98025-1 [Araneus ventricosus]|uniref:Uncharacterized protein n=1 Tax=Araneus ventricosus TaxID=182803 RepID=A0A4Y2G6E1_ARAVE|nr:hypothetical protein AVEN_98025-1 [Araneus ventricosus]
MRGKDNAYAKRADNASSCPDGITTGHNPTLLASCKPTLTGDTGFQNFPSWTRRSRECTITMRLRLTQNRTPSLTPVPVTRPVTEPFDGQDTGILFKKKNKIK